MRTERWETIVVKVWFDTEKLEYIFPQEQNLMSGLFLDLKFIVKYNKNKYTSIWVRRLSQSIPPGVVKKYKLKMNVFSHKKFIFFGPLLQYISL